MIIRDQSPSDRADVRGVVSAAFGQPDEAVLVEALNAAGDAEVSLVAEADDVLVGHVLFSKL